MQIQSFGRAIYQQDELSQVELVNVTDSSVEVAVVAGLASLKLVVSLVAEDFQLAENLFG